MSHSNVAVFSRDTPSFGSEKDKSTNGKMFSLAKESGNSFRADRLSPTSHAGPGILEKFFFSAYETSAEAFFNRDAFESTVEHDIPIKDVF